VDMSVHSNTLPSFQTKQYIYSCFRINT
jgi:hypothetical protein